MRVFLILICDSFGTTQSVKIKAADRHTAISYVENNMSEGQDMSCCRQIMEVLQGGKTDNESQEVINAS